VKKGEQPEFSAKWWKGSQPKGLKSASKLDDALKDYDDAKKKLEQAGDPDAAKAARDALGGIESAAKAVVAEASKAKNAPEMDWTVESLKKFDRLYAPEQAWIEQRTEESDEGVFADEEAYHTYLTASLKKLRTGGEMNFGFVLGKKAEDHRLAMHRSKGSKALANTLVKQTGLHAMTFGIATPSEDRPGVIVLALEGRQLPGMGKKGARMLKKFKPLPFTKLVMMVDGQEVEDLEDPEDADVDEADEAETEGQEFDAGALARELAALIRRIAALTDPTRKAVLGKQANDANTALKGGSLTVAASGISALRAALDAVANGQGGNGQAGNGKAGNGTGTVAYAKSRLAWLAARKKVESDIDKLGNEIVATYQEEGIGPELGKLYRDRVSPILETLDESLADKLDAAINATDPAQRTELVTEARGIMERYQAFIDREEIIASLDTNPFLPLTIQQTLSATLSALSKAVH
jgi:hypothetical protein